MGKNYFEIVYQGPFKGMHTALPEDVIPIENSPFMQNFILKDGEIRTRPFQGSYMPGPPDKTPILGIQSFTDQNNVVHTVCVTSGGLWQLNRSWTTQPITSSKTWQLVGKFLTQPGSNYPLSSQIFINKFFWTNGGPHLWMWDGIGSSGASRAWAKNVNFLKGSIVIDNHGNAQHANNSGTTGNTTLAGVGWSNILGGITIDGTIKWTQNGKYIPANGFIDSCVVDATNGITAGGYFVIELNSQLLLLNTVESLGGNFSQRIRWCPSGLPGIWDPNVNIGAGFNDELDVPDIISGGFSVGTTAFILRINGITEVTSNGNATNPFSFNHLWASKKGIGNILPFGFASYGPLGIFISSDDIYSVSMGGFKRIAEKVKNRIFDDIGKATAAPMASIVPYYASNYIYNHYKLAIPTGVDTRIWNYCIEEDSWQFEINTECLFSGQTNWVYTN